MKSKLTIFSLLLVLTITSLSSQAQENKKRDVFDSLQVLTINGIITAVYDLVSGPAGDRNWNRLRFLCLPNASFNSVKIKADGTEEFFNGDVDDYINFISPTLKQYAYYENEVERSIQSSDNIANVFSTYQSVTFYKEGTVSQKGVNSFQLVYKNNRWWIINILWKNEPLEQVPNR